MSALESFIITACHDDLLTGLWNSLCLSDSAGNYLAMCHIDRNVVSAELSSLTASQLMEKVRGLQNLAYQLGWEEGKSLTHRYPKSRFEFANCLSL